MPEWFSMTNLEHLNLSYNQITGQIAHFPVVLSSLDLSHNLLSGPLPKDLPFNKGLVRASLCQLLFLYVLNLQNNAISGTIPDCWGNSSYLDIINLSFNRLSGAIPKSIGLLQRLQLLNLNSNFLEGHIPPTLQHCRSLLILDLGENKLSGEVPSMSVKTHPDLQILRLRGNQLGGTIPPELCSLPQLQIFDLAQNNLTGNIPQCIGNFKGMVSSPSLHIIFDQDILNGMEIENQIGVAEVLRGEERYYTTTMKFLVNLDLSYNGLVGSISEELANLSGLKGLNMSYNHLTGSMPNRMGEMSSLESVDLSNNNLSGTIPSSMSALHFLSHLNLSYNKLHGEIPAQGQFQTLNDPSIYRGNPGLCGDPLPNKC